MQIKYTLTFLLLIFLIISPVRIYADDAIMASQVNERLRQIYQAQVDFANVLPSYYPELNHTYPAFYPLCNDWNIIQDAEGRYCDPRNVCWQGKNLSNTWLNTTPDNSTYDLIYFLLISSSCPRNLSVARTDALGGGCAFSLP